MTNDVFISWSGQNSLSHDVALSIRDILPKIIQSTTCFVSSHDIAAGTVWLNHLLEALNQSSCGILCLTSEVLETPWIAFEAGALVTKFDQSRVIPLLIDIEPKNVTFPIAALQYKVLNKEGLWDVVRAVNQLPGKTPLDDSVLSEAFELRWPGFENRVAELRKSHASTTKPKKRSTDEKIDELLGLVRSLQKEETTASNVDEYRPKVTLREVVNGKNVFKALLERVKEQRPLIAAWVAAVDRVHMDKDGVIHMVYPASEASMVKSLSREPTRIYLDNLASEVDPGSWARMGGD